MRKILCAAAVLTIGAAAGVYFAKQSREVEVAVAPAPPGGDTANPVAVAPLPEPTLETFEPILVEGNSPFLAPPASAGETVIVKGIATSGDHPIELASAVEYLPVPRPDAGASRRMPYADEDELRWLVQSLKTPLERILASHDAGLLPRGVFGGEEESEEGRRQR